MVHPSLASPASLKGAETDFDPGRKRLSTPILSHAELARAGFIAVGPDSLDASVLRFVRRVVPDRAQPTLDVAVGEDFIDQGDRVFMG